VLSELGNKTAQRTVRNILFLVGSGARVIYLASAGLRTYK
jgi:hypothetical protein